MPRAYKQAARARADTHCRRACTPGVRRGRSRDRTPFPNPADSQAAINFNHRLTGHIIKLTADLQVETVCVCRFYFLLK
eukprot:COSAG02_NODE_180_length_31057_cov_21.869501_9_plen_79_part_00